MHLIVFFASPFLAIASEKIAIPNVKTPPINKAIIPPAIGIRPTAIAISRYTKNAPTAKPQRPESASRACVIKSLFDVTIKF